METYPLASTDLLTARGVAHLVVQGTIGSTSYETIPPVPLETSGGVLSTVDMVVQRRDGPRWLRDRDDDDDDEYSFQSRRSLLDLRSHLTFVHSDSTNAFHYADHCEVTDTCRHVANVDKKTTS